MVATHARAVVVGGGVVGCSLLYHLARAGWQDLVLLERLELTAGSTWHAAGNVTYFGHYPAITRLYADAIATYREVAAETGRDVGFHATGGLRLATTAAELAYYRRLVPLFRDLGIGYEVVAPEALPALHPLLATDGLLGAAHTQGDGHVDPAGVTQAMAAAARDRGASVRRFEPVLELQRLDSGAWRVVTDRDSLTADHVVLAASFWSRALAAQAGRDLPLFALEHHEIVTEAIPALADLGFELPTVRDPAAPANVRQEGQGLLIGVYETDPRPWGVDGIPPDFGQELLPSDLDRLTPHVLKAAERIPALGEAGLKAVNNGPICYTPDGNPLLGPDPQLPGLWHASGFCVGIGTGGGAGLFLARWMVDGAAPYDLPAVHPARFPDDVDKQQAIAQICETYAKGYELPPLKA